MNFCVYKHIQHKTQEGNCPLFCLETQLSSVQQTPYNIVKLFWAASSNGKPWCDGQQFRLTFVKFKEQKCCLVLMVFNRAGGRIREQSSQQFTTASFLAVKYVMHMTHLRQQGHVSTACSLSNKYAIFVYSTTHHNTIAFTKIQTQAPHNKINFRSLCTA